MTDEAALEALDWLEAHHGKPVTAAWYTEHNGKLVQRVQPKSGKIGSWSDGRWFLTYSSGLMRIIDRRQFASCPVVVDKRRLVIDYGGKGRFVIEASEG